MTKLQIPIESTTLSNSLRVVISPDHAAPFVTVGVYYNIGFRLEPQGRSGFAHLFEHMMFQGSANAGKMVHIKLINSSGGVLNGSTRYDVTNYFEAVPSNALERSLWLEADRMRNLEISEKTFNTEKEVVKEERRLRFDNQPYGTVIETLYRHAYTVHPYGHLPIGSMEDLDHAALSDVRGFYDKYYVPQNATLVIVRDFERNQAESMLREYFGPIARGSVPLERAIPAEPRQTAERTVKVTLNVALPAFVAAYHMPADGTPDAYPLRLAARILAEGESSRLHRRLIYEDQIALQAESAGNFTEDPNLVFVMAVMNPGHTPGEGKAAIEKELDRLRTEPVTAAELDKAKNQILRDFVQSRQSVQSLGEQLGYAAVILKDPELLDAELDRFLSVTSDDIQRVARTYFVPENSTLMEVIPAEGAVPKAGD